MAKRSSKQKLIGWGVFAAMLVVIVAIFLVTRMLGGGPQPDMAASVADTGPASSTAPAVSSATTSAADSATASSASASVEAPGPAGAQPAATSPEAASSGPVVQVVDAGTMTQQSRRGFLLTLIQQGVLTGVQALDTPPKVGVTALFEGLSPTLQQQFIAVVYAYINNGAAGTQTLQLIDARNGVQVGSYSTSDGLKLGEG